MLFQSRGGVYISFPKLTFPLQVDFGMTCYWIEDRGPFSYGKAVTAFFSSESLADNIGDELWPMQELEVYLQLSGYAPPTLCPWLALRGNAQLLRYTDAEKNVDCAIHYSLCSGKALMQFS